MAILGKKRFFLEFTSREAAAPLMSVAAPEWFWKFWEKIQNFGKIWKFWIFWKISNFISKVGGKLWRREGYMNGNFCDITKSTWGSTSVKAKKCIYKPRLPRYPNFSLDYNQMQRNSDCIIHCGFTPKGHQQGVLEVCWFGDDWFVCLRLVYSSSAWPRNAAQDDKLSIMETN